MYRSNAYVHNKGTTGNGIFHAVHPEGQWEKLASDIQQGLGHETRRSSTVRLCNLAMPREDCNQTMTSKDTTEDLVHAVSHICFS
jgi:hypothetical protein